MRFRKLRIAWSVGWGIPAVLLIVLWVRSCSKRVFVYYREGTTATGVSSQADGLVAFWNSSPYSHFGFGWALRTFKPDKFGDTSTSRFTWDNSRGFKRIGVPHWFAVLAVTSLAVGPWIRWRFSLRTLLIATTLIAVVLGLIVYATQ